MQPVFQDPTLSFNPRRTVGDALRQALWRLDPAEHRARSITLLERVGLRPAAGMLDRYPHELSGGQRQRLAVARAVGDGAEADRGRRTTLRRGTCRSAGRC
ncbi:MAG: ATP-binding cassette domain-containing protein [Acetobacteraceae bacterium]